MTRPSPDVVISIFRRRGAASPNTIIVPDLSDDIREQLLQGVEMQSGESPLLLFQEDGRVGYVLTDQRLIACTDSLHIALESIESANFALDDAPGPNDVHQIRIATTSGEEHMLTLEPGAPLFGFIAVLKFLAKRT